jgi:hypothetical protein
MVMPNFTIKMSQRNSGLKKRRDQSLDANNLKASCH